MIDEVSLRSLLSGLSRTISDLAEQAVFSFGTAQLVKRNQVLSSSNLSKEAQESLRALPLFPSSLFGGRVSVARKFDSEKKSDQFILAAAARQSQGSGQGSRHSVHRNQDFRSSEREGAYKRKAAPSSESSRFKRARKAPHNPLPSSRSKGAPNRGGFRNQKSSTGHPQQDTPDSRDPPPRNTAGSLALHVPHWRALGAGDWVCKTLESGFRLKWGPHKAPLSGSPIFSSPPSNMDSREVLALEVMSLLAKGATEEIFPPWSPGFYGRLFFLCKESIRRLASRSGSEYVVPVSRKGQVQDGDPCFNSRRYQTRRLGSQHRPNRRLLPHPDFPRGQEVPQVHLGGQSLRFQSPALRPVSGPLAVHEDST